jgi:hypothetical protein
MRHDLDYRAAKQFVRDLHLEPHAPELARLFRAIDPARPRERDARVMRRINELLQPFREYHEQNPFPTAPPGTFTGQYTLAYQAANNLPVLVDDLVITGHIGDCGPTGSTKTSMALRIVDQVLANNRKVFLLDPKDDSLHVAVNNPRFLILSPHAKINLLQRPSFLSVEEFTNVFAEIWGKCWYAGENQKQVLDEGLERAFADHHEPSLKDVERIIGGMASPKETFQRRDAVAGVTNRLRRFGKMFPEPYAANQGITYDELFQHPLYMNVLLNDEYTTFWYTLLVHLLFLHNRRKGIRDTLDYLLVNDEGNKFWNVQQSNIGEAPTLVNLQGMLREFGIGLLHTSVDQASLHPILKSNTYTQIVMGAASGREAAEVARNLNLTPDQRTLLRTGFRRGQCIIKFAGGPWQEPILATFPHQHYDKHVSPADRAAAEQRINTFAPPEQPPTLTEPGARPERSSEQAAPKQHMANARPARNDGEQRAPIKLTPPEEQLLRAAADAGIIPTTDAFRQAQLSRQPGTNAKSRLVAIGLLTTASVLVKRGRGGNAQVLRPTPEGYALLGKKPRFSTRGGDGDQHFYNVVAVANALADVEVEASLGGKSIDILVKYAPLPHKRLTPFLTNDDVKAGELLAIEVEVAPTRTALNNITKNATVGIAHTLVAVMPKHVETTRAHLEDRVSDDARDAYTVVDIFELLEGLRQ